MSKEQYYKREREAKAEIARREQEIADLKVKLGDYHILTSEQTEELERYCQTVEAGFDSATFEDKCKYLEWLKVECFYNDETKEIAINGILGPHTVSLVTSTSESDLPRTRSHPALGVKAGARRRAPASKSRDTVRRRVQHIDWRAREILKMAGQTIMVRMRVCENNAAKVACL